MNRKTGVLLINLGSPDSPANSDVRRYLTQFLLDWRVIDIPPVQRNLLVRGIIAPFRAPKSAVSYKAIWTQEGSPLVSTTTKQAQLLQQLLGTDYQVEYAMRYQNPSIESVIEKFKNVPLKKLVILPLYPHYSGSSTGSVNEEVMRILSKWQVIPPVEFINSYFDHPGLIRSFVARGEEKNPAQYDHVLFSFHGLPERQLLKADIHHFCLQSENCCESITEKNAYCYSAQCHATAYLIAKQLNIPREKFTICFQSRLGRTPWKQPFTVDVIHKLAKEGVKRLLVFSPAFVTDCLETIFEIGVEYKAEFKSLGGEELTLVEGLNTHPEWIGTLGELVRGGW